MTRATEAAEPELEVRPYEMIGSERFDLVSRHVGDTFRIDVALPAVMVPGERYRVLYMPDAAPNFAAVAMIAREGAEADIAAPIEQLVIAAIGYTVDSREYSLRTRRRDLTPPGWKRPPAWPVPASAVDAETGGADRFLRFIHEELDPIIRSRYPCLLGPAGLFGASLGGYFALYAMLIRTPLFDRYIVSSGATATDEDVARSLEEAIHAGGGKGCRCDCITRWERLKKHCQAAISPQHVRTEGW